MKYQKLLAILVICGTVNTGHALAQQTDQALKTAYKNNFLMGTALNREHIFEKNEKADRLIKGEFNAITAENVMKSAMIHPEYNRYDFEQADRFVAYGLKNKMYVVGHTLIWHSQLSPFVSKISSADSLKLFMADHIKTIVGRYSGKIASWDVVNEALNEDGTLRPSVFFNKLGDRYIQEAFELAARADPKVELYYNDYNIEQPAKRKGAMEIIRKLQANGTKIDGVGIQGHWHLSNNNLKDIEDAIVDFSKLGIKVAFTELDISVLPNPENLNGADVGQRFEGKSAINPYPDALPDSVETALAKRYEDIFRIFLKHRDKISRVTFWGVDDGHSWLNGWPVPGRTNYPLLFDRAFEPKKAYEAILKLTSVNK
jgi:endo-1,4-beta-xylanase